MDHNRKTQDEPTRSSNMEQAEGSRETVRENLKQGDGDGAKGGGITNRELEREQSEQEKLPQRGHSQSEG